MGRIKLIHYHTNTKDAVPAVENLAEGEIALNTHPESSGLFIKSSNGEIKNIGFSVSGNGCSSIGNYFRSGAKSANAVPTGKNKGVQFFMTNMYTEEALPPSRDGYILQFNWASGAYCSQLCVADGVHPTIYTRNHTNEDWETTWTTHLNEYNGPDLIGKMGFAKTSDVTKKLTIAGLEYNGTEELTIDSLDCGEF